MFTLENEEGKKERKEEERRKHSKLASEAPQHFFQHTHAHTPSFTNKLNLNISITNAGSPIDDEKHETKPADIIALSVHSLRFEHERNNFRFWRVKGEDDSVGGAIKLKVFMRA